MNWQLGSISQLQIYTINHRFINPFFIPVYTILHNPGFPGSRNCCLLKDRVRDHKDPSAQPTFACEDKGAGWASRQQRSPGHPGAPQSKQVFPPGWSVPGCIFDRMDRNGNRWHLLLPTLSKNPGMVQGSHHWYKENNPVQAMFARHTVPSGIFFQRRVLLAQQPTARSREVNEFLQRFHTQPKSRERFQQYEAIEDHRKQDTLKRVGFHPGCLESRMEPHSF